MSASVAVHAKLEYAPNVIAIRKRMGPLIQVQIVTQQLKANVNRVPKLSSFGPGLGGGGDLGISISAKTIPLQYR